jgi:polyhydroxyalkanoate synthase
MNNLNGDINAWQEQYAQLMSTLFEESMGSVIFAAFTADMQEAWGRLVRHWEESPEQLESIQDTWKAALNTYAESIKTPQNNPLSSVKHLKGLHGELEKCLKQTINDAPGINETDQRLLNFCSRQLINALAAENWPMTNEAVVKKAFESQGASIMQGMKNFQDHLFAGKNGFEVKTSREEDYSLGVTLAVTPGEVIFQNHLFQLIQYYPFSQQVNKEPLLIIPPWINKYYVLDLSPTESFVQWAVKQGHSVFIMSWVNPDQRHKELDLDDYLSDGALEAIDVVKRICDCDKVNLLGFCIGGLLAGLTAAWLKQKGSDDLNSLTLLNTMFDYSDPGEVAVFLSERMLAAVDKTVGETGLLNGAYLRKAFTLLREDRMFWPYVVNNYFLGNAPKPNPLLYWNNDSANLAATMFKTYINDMYLQNKLFTGQSYEFAGQAIRLDAIDIPVLAVAGRADHIVPWGSAFSSVLPMQDVEFVLSDAGHIVGVLNPPSKQRYAYWHGAIMGDAVSAESWLKKAQRNSGSWWGHWDKWLSGCSDEMIRARFPGEGGLEALENAPGSYVKE